MSSFSPGLANLSTVGGCDYLDLIVLATTGGSNGARTVIESHGDLDPCCFYKAEYAAGAPYFDYMASVVASLGGTYQGVFDSNLNHNYSSSRRRAIKAPFDNYS